MRGFFFSKTFSFGIVEARISVLKGILNIRFYALKCIFVFMRTTNVKKFSVLSIMIKIVMSTVISSFILKFFHCYAITFQLIYHTNIYEF